MGAMKDLLLEEEDRRRSICEFCEGAITAECYRCGEATCGECFPLCDYCVHVATKDD